MVKGELDVPFKPIEVAFFRFRNPADEDLTMCPVNVHYHVGAEHNSDGQYDQPFESGVNGPVYDPKDIETMYPFLGPGKNYTGKRCNFYRDPERYGLKDSYFFDNYKFEHCIGAKVGETYEIHWPHSSLGACEDDINQYQSPFNDGLVCLADPSLPHGAPVPIGAIPAGQQALAELVGVQAQVFTIVDTPENTFYYPNLIRGMVVNKELGFGQDITAYTGSRTGATFGDQPGDERCDAASPVSWQVDRSCHLLEARALDKMCKDIKENPGMRRCDSKLGSFLA